jgi:putative two-component system response regulator
MNAVQPKSNQNVANEYSRILDSRILVVDDNASNVLLLEKMLYLKHFQYIHTVTDPREFFSAFHEFAPDLILLDLQMPYFDGFSILEWLRGEANGDFLPVIVITAQNDKENKLHALRLGAHDFIGKPFDNVELMTRISNIMQVKLLHDKVRENNVYLEQKVQERTKEIYNLQMEIVDRLMRAAEFRDQETGDHIARIGKYVYLLARKLGYGEEEARLISNASKMHDIGKIGVSDQILFKPGRLTNEEMTQMKEHTVKGAQILLDSKYELLNIAEQIARSHHERWNGRGYPDRLEGEKIPLVGRITALADVFDALISVRPYKRGWSFEQVVSYIIEQRGHQFDPMVVDAFLEQMDAFKAIIENRPEAEV